ncbi:Probable polygalacturonase [Striga hermonthica]|uniref:Probable polygalacturonase n=1 Tax=Striga hermonthica TaxID=68872 RepID=A0A9N7RFH6_STRHE|nr:Probable polygalacturonase [Striga hermonthica]
MRFSRCKKLQVRGLKYINSQRNHISLNECDYARISRLDIRAPQTSPNTDGIDISASTNLDVLNCVMATDITFVEANNPVIIDQFYCPHLICSKKASAVQVSDVTFSGLHGTSSCKNATVNLSCSETVPCNNIVLDDVDIESALDQNSASAHCVNAHGRANTQSPVVNCLKKNLER